MSEYEFILWVVIVSMALFAFCVWSVDRLIENEKPTPLQKRLEQINREADELLKQANRKLEKRVWHDDTRWGPL